MSVFAENWAYAQTVIAPGDKKPSSGAKFVLVAVGQHADEVGYCYPSQDRLALMTDQAVRTVRAHLATLEQLGFIKRAPRRIAGHRTSDAIWLQAPAEALNPYGSRRPLDHEQEPQVSTQVESPDSNRQILPVAVIGGNCTDTMRQDSPVATGEKQQTNRQKTADQPAESAGKYPGINQGNNQVLTQQQQQRARAYGNDTGNVPSNGSAGNGSRPQPDWPDRHDDPAEAFVPDIPVSSQPAALAGIVNHSEAIDPLGPADPFEHPAVVQWIARLHPAPGLTLFQADLVASAVGTDQPSLAIWDRVIDVWAGNSHNASRPGSAVDRWRREFKRWLDDGNQNNYPRRIAEPIGSAGGGSVKTESSQEKQVRLAALLQDPDRADVA